MRKFGSVLAAAMLTAGVAYAQDVNGEDADEQRLETVTVTGQLSDFGATKTTTPILETARSISIETEEQFRDKGALTLAASFDYASGVDAGTYGPATRGDFASIRGFDAAEYRDGQQVLFGYYNNTRTDIYMLEQVEVLKGPASVLYGKGTPGGIVNAVSKLAGPDKTNEVVFDIGTNERYQAAGDFNLQLSQNVYARLVGVYRDSGTQVDRVNDDAVILMPSISYDNGTACARRSAKTLPPQRSVLWPWCHGSQCSSASFFIIYYYNTLNIILMIHNTLISKIDVAVCALRRVSPSCDYRAM